jgi:hypothetical protein
VLFCVATFFLHFSFYISLATSSEDDPSSSSPKPPIVITAVDVYSMAVMLWQLWYKTEPWEGLSPHKVK